MSKLQVQMRLPVQDLFVNSAGVIHGGMISSKTDVAMSNLIPATGDNHQFKCFFL